MKKSNTFTYNNSEIIYCLSKHGEVEIDAVSMGEIFDKNFDDFRQSDSTKQLIQTLLTLKNKREDEHDRENGTIKQIHESDLIIRYGSRIYLAEIIAKKFATWLDTEFEIWLSENIEKVKFKNYGTHFTAANDFNLEKKKYNDLKLLAISQKNELALKIVECYSNLERLKNTKRNALVKQTKEISKTLFEI